MKYTVSIEIALPRERVAQLLADSAHLPKWLRGLVLHEPLSGMHGQVGTESRVVMQTGQQMMEATETITRREPADLHGIPRDTVVHFEFIERGAETELVVTHEGFANERARAEHNAGWIGCLDRLGAIAEQLEKEDRS